MDYTDNATVNVTVSGEQRPHPPGEPPPLVEQVAGQDMTDVVGADDGSGYMVLIHLVPFVKTSCGCN